MAAPAAVRPSLLRLRQKRRVTQPADQQAAWVDALHGEFGEHAVEVAQLPEDRHLMQMAAAAPCGASSMTPTTRTLLSGIACTVRMKSEASGAQPQISTDTSRDLGSGP